ncbi:MAG TPA: DUF72 domain-containing protein [Marmoricola sp.]|nr:DUF72 domain-containing protein [Marmoricola sp.]
MTGLHIGTSGWSYDHWEGVLYPPGLPTAKRRGVYVEHFDTVELNASFYRWPREQTFETWNRDLPPGFVMSVKAPRGLTHARRLREPGPWIDRLTKAWHALRDRRGVLLVQLHPAHERDDERLDTFLSLLPDWMRVAVEFRHPSWHVEEVMQVLERHGAAYVVMSGANLPCVLRATAPFVYVRLHGPSDQALYAGSYSDADLRWWAERIREWQAQDREVFAYFNNDGEGHAVVNADTLRTLLGQRVPDGDARS